MIGSNYWSTGISFRRYPDRTYGLKLDFWDDGFCQADATAGRLHSRYDVHDLARGIDVLVADAERLGIEWRVGPSIYTYQDGELHDGDHPELRHLANEQADRLGWEPTYDRESVEA